MVWLIWAYDHVYRRNLSVKVCFKIREKEEEVYTLIISC